MENNKEVILGLDVSTTCIGCCLISYDDKELNLLELTHVVPKVSKKNKTIESLFLKDDIFRENFLYKFKDFGITKVVIEEPLLNSNNVYTVGTLLRFNGMISKSVFEVLKIVPTFISSYDARLYAFPDLMDVRKFGKDGEMYSKQKIVNSLKNNKLSLFGNFTWDCPKKQILQAKVAEMFPKVEWIYDKKGELKKENFDSSDAFVCCYGFINKEKFGDLNFNVSDIKVEDNCVSYCINYWDVKNEFSFKTENE